MLAIGIDACPGGWVAVSLRNGELESATVRKTFEHLLDLYPAGTVGVDIPIGLPDVPGRPADAAARFVLGSLGRSVFDAFPRVILEATSYETAKARCLERDWPKPSLQSFGMAKRIFEVEAAIGRHPDRTIIEVHPEVSFRHMNGEPLDYSKSSLGGWQHRWNLLESKGIHLWQDRGDLPLIDTLDAAAAAWSADRYGNDPSSCARYPGTSSSRDHTIWA
ncbi:MAG: DUF429 domain-containing protein [Actinobacteria bacterium]|nr:DUF429 domain-containing protein [Actinomycetota bacterium]